MPEIYMKDTDGNFKSLGNVDTSSLLNVSALDKCVQEFWTEKKSGKHPKLAKRHKEILLQDLIAKPEDLFEQLNQNKFTFQNFGPLKLANFLVKAKLDSYLRPEFVQHCLEVTTAQPAIGKGEFLLVSCFSNINFSDESGDLIDDAGNRIEVKGSHASIGGAKNFKQMNKSVMFSIYNTFGTNPDYTDFTMGCAEDLRQRLIDNPDKIKKTMLLLQNNEKESDSLAEAMTSLFKDNQDLLNIVAAAHLYAYLRLQKANFLFAINDKYFAGFETPRSLRESYDVIKGNFKVNGWTTGNEGITFTLKVG